MPSKSSRRKRAKNPPPSKQRTKAAAAKTRPVNVAETNTEAPEQPVAAPAPTPATRKASVSARTRAQEIIETAEVYAHVKPELATIGILAVVMLAILGILAAVL